MSARGGGGGGGGRGRRSGGAVAQIGETDQQGLDLVRVEAEQAYGRTGRTGHRPVDGDRGGLGAVQTGGGAEQPEHQRLVRSAGCGGQVVEGRLRPDGPARAQQSPSLATGHRAQRRCRRPGVQLRVEQRQRGPAYGGTGRGHRPVRRRRERRTDQPGGGQPAGQERLQRGQVGDPAGGDGGLQSAGVGVRAGREAAVGQQQEQTRRRHQNRKYRWAIGRRVTGYGSTT